VDRISHVINFGPPADRKTDVHRIGRTGRAGRTGVGITVLSTEQPHDVTKLAGHLDATMTCTTRAPAVRSLIPHVAQPQLTGAGRAVAGRGGDAPELGADLRSTLVAHEETAPSRSG